MNERVIIHRIAGLEDDEQKYGIPEQKKFPMPDAAHVRSAIRFFNYVEPRYEKQLAKAILKRMKEYGLTFDDFTVGEENRFSKYIPQIVALEHHGIKGQRWGVRRFQNADGTLTPAGKRHYGVGKVAGKSYPSYDEMQATVKQKSMEKAYDKALDRKDKSDIANLVKNTAEQTKNALNRTKNDYKESKKNVQVKPDVSKMSNKELQDAITRMNLEDNYTRLIQNREAQKQGKDRVEKMLDTMGTVAEVASTAAAVATIIFKIVGI